MSDRTLDELWNQLLDASRLTRCYDKLATYYGGGRAVVRITLAVSALGVTGAITGTPILEGFSVPFAILLAIFTAIDLTADLDHKRRTLGQLATSYAILESRWGNLLRRAEEDGMSVEALLHERQALVEQHEELDRIADGAGIVTWRWLNNRCEEAARRIHAPTP